MARVGDPFGRLSTRRELALVSLLALVALPGCPMTDDYFVVDQGASSGSSGVGGSDDGNGGTAPKGDAGSGGFAAMTGGISGAGGDAGTGGASGSGGNAAGGGSAGDWRTTSPPPGGFSPREKAAYVSTGSQLFIWGGVNESGTALNSGALYDPRDDRWQVVANDAHTPTPRSLPSAVWTGSVVVVWGGFDPVSMQPLTDGAIYDPVDDAWSEMNPGPMARAAAVGVSSDDRVVFFGGHDGVSPLGGLDVYDRDTDSWEPGMEGSPPATADPAAAGGALTFWTYGGRTAMNTGVTDLSYWSMSSARWLGLDPLGPGRWGSFAAFANATFFVWGGRDVSGSFADGFGYDIASSQWEDMSAASAPSARFVVERESGWTFAVDPDGFRPSVVVIGGLEAPGSYLRDGAIYDTGGRAWHGIPAWPSTASHAFGAAGIASEELIVWGGRDNTTLTNEGVRYDLSDWANR
jgi:hypothetical protein